MQPSEVVPSAIPPIHPEGRVFVAGAAIAAFALFWSACS
jgi:hypothetical protein